MLNVEHPAEYDERLSVPLRWWVQGVMLVATQRHEPFPDGAEVRLAAFTDLVGTAVANAEAHLAMRAFADEQERKAGLAPS